MSRLIPHEALAEKGIPLSKDQLIRLERAGTFPKRVKISQRRFGWVELEIDRWLAQRVAARDAVAA
jgi:prophage regulatory protein